MFLRKRTFLPLNKMNKEYLVESSQPLHKNGSLIFCGNCDKLIASINQKGCRYINLNITCSCGTSGDIELAKSDSTSDPYERIGKMPHEADGLAVCKRCGTRMFGVITERVTTYSFYAECVCGEKYDIKSTYGKRLGETFDMFKKMKG